MTPQELPGQPQKKARNQKSWYWLTVLTVVSFELCLASIMCDLAIHFHDSVIVGLVNLITGDAEPPINHPDPITYLITVAFAYLIVHFQLMPRLVQRWGQPERKGND